MLTPEVNKSEEQKTGPVGDGLPDTIEGLLKFLGKWTDRERKGRRKEGQKTEGQKQERQKKEDKRTKLVASGLPHDVTEDQIKEHFKKFNPVSVRILRPVTNRHFPTAFIVFSPEQLKDVIHEMNESKLGEKAMTVRHYKRFPKTNRIRVYYQDPSVTAKTLFRQYGQRKRVDLKMIPDRKVAYITYKTPREAKRALMFGPKKSHHIAEFMKKGRKLKPRKSPHKNKQKPEEAEEKKEEEKPDEQTKTEEKPKKQTEKKKPQQKVLKTTEEKQETSSEATAE